MDKIFSIKKRMVYPETLNLTTGYKNKIGYGVITPTTSWQETEITNTITDHPVSSPVSEVAATPPPSSVTSSEDEEEIRTTKEFSADSVEEENFHEISAVLNRLDHDADDDSELSKWSRKKLHEYLQGRKDKLQRQGRPSLRTASTCSSNNGILDGLTPYEDAWLSPNHNRNINRDNLLLYMWSRLVGAFAYDVIDPHGKWHVAWLFVVTLCFMYNCWVIPLRSTFPYQTPDNIAIWFSLDYTADLVYLIDMLVIKPRLSYIEDGFWVRDVASTRKNYQEKYQFRFDMCSLIPLDLFYLVLGTDFLMLRLPRMLKTFWQCYDQLDKMLPSAFIVRLTRTLTYMLYLIHLNACAYYAFSAYSGLGKNGWVFSGKGSAYIRCFYFATKTATSIGKNPKPETEPESLFMTCSWLMGVFVFAILIGQMRDIIVTANHTRSEYRQLMDVTGTLMRRLNIPSELQGRVRQWFTFTWEQQHTLDERRILNALPQKMRTDLCINVHYKTLSKVQLFHDCDEALLRELVLKLRPVMFLPGDYICHKGEVGKEMYIVKTGEVDVLGGDNNDEILATLAEGSVFGEISLLSLTGGNRRTADVRSRGYSGLFVLSKADLNEAIKHYPEAQEILKKKAKLPKSIKTEMSNSNSVLMRENAAREKMQRRKRELEQLCASTSETKLNYSGEEDEEEQSEQVEQIQTVTEVDQKGCVKLSWNEDNSWVYGTSVRRKKFKKKRKTSEEQPPSPPKTEKCRAMFSLASTNYQNLRRSAPLEGSRSNGTAEFLEVIVHRSMSQ